MVNLDFFTEGNIEFPYNNITSEKLKLLVNKICEFIKIDNVSITIIFTDNNSIQEINKNYRNKDYATDVISFAYRENPFPGIEQGVENLGDIYLSLEKAVSQAKEYQVTFYEEVKRLLIHGVLHLIGYDHERSKEDEIEMQNKEDELFDNV